MRINKSLITFTPTSGSGSGSVTSVALSATMPTGLTASISGSPITSSGTLGLTLTFSAGYSIPTTAKQTEWDSAYTNRITSLTTTGSSGAATLASNVLNIPNYTLSGLGGVPTTRTITINGTSFDLSANRTYNVGTVTSVAALTIGTSGTDVSSSVANGTTTPVITLNIPTASATNRGALSSTDWLAFSSKQPAITLTTTGSSGSSTLIGATLNVPTYTLVGLGGMSNPFTTGIGQMIYSNGAGAPLSLAPNTTTTKKYLSMTGDGTNGDAPFWDTIPASVGGSGTTNYIAKFTSTNAIGVSLIYDNGTNVGIGTPTPQVKLDVVGSGTISGVASLGISEITNLAYIGDRNTTNTRYIKFNRASSLTDIVNIQGVNGGIGAANISLQSEGANVGIGTITPAQKLNIEGDGVRLRLSTASSPSTYFFDIEQNFNSANTLNFYATGGANILRWIFDTNALCLQPSTGNVVIGTTVANAKFQVNGGGLATTGSTAFMVSAGLSTGRLDSYQAGTATCIHTFLDANTYEISAGSTADYVSGIAITGRSATLNPSAVRVFTRSTQRMQIGDLGQLQLNAYTSATSFTGTPVAYLACDSSGNIITSNPSSGRNTRLAFSAEVPNTWSNMPSTLQFFDSSSAYVTQIDLTYYNQVRLIVNKQGTAGATGSKLLVRYQATTGAPFTESSYLAIGTSEVSLAVDTTNNILVTSWIDLVSGAKSDVWVALMGIDGDTTADPVFGNIYAEFRFV